MPRHTSFTSYMRYCSKCDELFRTKTKGRTRRVCPKCRIKSGRKKHPIIIKKAGCVLAYYG